MISDIEHGIQITKQLPKMSKRICKNAPRASGQLRYGAKGSPEGGGLRAYPGGASVDMAMNGYMANQVKIR